jgi:predicted Zn-dependent peptidase
MLHRGTEGHPSSLELNRAFESLGGTLMAETGRDYSSFSLALGTDLVGEGLGLLGELLSRPLFSDIELERALILEELSADYDERGVELHGSDIARGVTFGDHPLAQRIVGPRANVERFTTDDVSRHFQRLYGARNTIVCVAGPLDPAAVFDQIGRAFADQHEGTEAPLSAPPPPQDGPRHVTVRDPGSQTSVDILWRSIPETDPDYLTSLALLRVIDDGMSTRLHYRLADQRGLAYSIGAGIEPLHDVALFEITGETANAKTVELVERALELVGELRDTRVDSDELEKVKRRYRFELACAMDDAGAVASHYGATALFYRPPSLEQRATDMDSVTADHVIEVARRVFVADQRTVVAVGSLSPASTGQLRELVGSH